MFTDSQRPWVIGHRGASGHEPENTMRGFERALELGVDAIEVDIRISADDVPVIIHDETLDRTTNGSGAVRQFGVSYLERLDCGEGEGIPRLDRVIQLVRSTDAGLVIDLKERRAVRPVLDLIAETDISDRALLISFRIADLRSVRRLAPDLEIGLLFRHLPRNLWNTVAELDPGYIVGRSDSLDLATIETAHEQGRRVVEWVVNDEPAFRQSIAKGVDGIETDLPANFVNHDLRRSQSDPAPTWSTAPP